MGNGLLAFRRERHPDGSDADDERGGTDRQAALALLEALGLPIRIGDGFCYDAGALLV